MKTIEISGYSDDIVEIGGDIRDEFGCYDKDFGIYSSDGTVLKIVYGDDGIWKIDRIAEGTAKFIKTDGTNPDTDYTDKVVLSGDIEWIIGGELLKVK